MINQYKKKFFLHVSLALKSKIKIDRIEFKLDKIQINKIRWQNTINTENSFWNASFEDQIVNG